MYLIAGESYDEAKSTAAEVLRILRDDPQPLFFAVMVEHVAMLAALGGDAERAARLLGFAEAQYRSFGVDRETFEQREHDRLLSRLSDMLDDERRDGLLAAGAMLGHDEAAHDAALVVA
jgi:hypothetical protein